jgi:CheY-like chemotaxis protein
MFISKPLFSSVIADTINQCLGTPEDSLPKDGSHPDDGCFAGYHILLAEDIEINREIAKALLEHTEIDILSAENGRQAVEMVQSNPDAYDLILMDIHMPEMDGHTATRNIRALDLPQAVKIPIVAMTANVFREDIEKCMAAGMNDHIGKPLDIDEVVATLKKYLPPRGRARSLSSGGME